MKKKVFAALIFFALTMFAACSDKAEQKTATAEEGQATEVKDVEGRKNFGKKTLIMPQPAIMIATYDADETPDVMMAAWGGQCGMNQISFELSAHKTTENLRLKKAFTVSFASKDNIAQSDYFGIVSANDVPDKVKRAGFTVTKSPNVDAPIVNEYPLTLECKVVKMEDDGNGGAHVVGEIVNMSAAESVLNEKGEVDTDKLLPVVFDATTNSYRLLGEKVGTAWGSGKIFQK